MNFGNIRFPSNINKTAHQFYRWAAFLFLLAFVLLAGCARQLRKPASGQPGEKVPVIRVALDDDFHSATLSFEGKYEFPAEEATYVLDASVGEFNVAYLEGELIFRSPHRWFEFKTFTSLEFRPIGDARFNWNGQPYSGILKFTRENGKVVVVNILPVPEYLRGVVPQEIPSHTQDYYPAIMAQAVAARTYAMYHIQHPAGQAFDVFWDTRDQYYGGLKGTARLSDEAIRETEGKVLRDENHKLVETQFHSTCGGILEMRSEYSADMTSLKDVSDGAYNCAGSPLYRWVEKLSTDRILRNLAKAGLLPDPEVRKLEENGYSMDIHVLSRTESGRVRQLQISLDKKDYLLGEWQTRKVMTDDPAKTLPSGLFFLTQSPQNADTLYVVGAGFGHGRGMCQWGAIGMALNGKALDDILKFYYPSLILNKIY